MDDQKLIPLSADFTHEVLLRLKQEAARRGVSINDVICTLLTSLVSSLDPPSGEEVVSEVSLSEAEEARLNGDIINDLVMAKLPPSQLM
jgi:hypothetical protein